MVKMTSTNNPTVSPYDELLVAVSERQEVSYFMTILQKKEIKKVLKSDAGISVFDKATSMGLTKVASLLLSHGVVLKPRCPGLKVNSYLHVAILCLDLDFASQLISLGADIEAVDSTGNSPLLLAIYMDNCPLAELLLKNGAHPSYWAQKRIFQQSPLGLAVERNNLDIVKLLLNCGTEIDCRELQHALYKAIYNGRDKIVLYLVTQGVKLYSSMTEDTTLLHIVSEFGCADTVEHILNQKMYLVNVRNSCGRTPLHSASINCNEIIPESGERDYILETVLVLLAHGSDIDTKDSMGMTPLMYSLKCHNHSVSEELINHGASVTSMLNSDSLLLLALEPSGLCTNCEIVDFILRCGADEIIDHMNDDGFTALTKSIELGHEHYISILLKYFPSIEQFCPNGLVCYKKLIHQYRTCFEIIDEMRHYFAFMELASLPISSNCKRAFAAVCPEFPNYQYDGEDEIKTMKLTKLVENLTVYEFLTKCVIDLMAYEQLFSEDVIYVFRYYSLHENILRKKLFTLRNKRVRQDLVYNISSCLLSIFGINLPILVVEKICEYLNNSELEKFVSAFALN